MKTFRVVLTPKTKAGIIETSVTARLGKSKATGRKPLR